MNATNNSTPTIIGIRFSKIGKNYYFDASKIANLNIGDQLVVQTSRGWQIGELAEIVSNTESLKNTNYKPVDRLATETDLIKHDEILEKNEIALKICIEELGNLNYSGLKLVSAEYSFDEKILSILYTCGTEDSPNLDNLRSKIGNRIPNTRIDFHKIGPRDAAKYFGGMGACGFECRCCAKFIGQFESISIRMAKKQGISLTPSDITGMCDRLRCCLSYEYCHYEEALKKLPRKNKTVLTPLGTGKVQDLAPLKNTIYVYLDDFGLREFQASEVEEIRVRDSQKDGKRRAPRKNHKRDNSQN